MKIAILSFPGTNRAQDIANCLYYFIQATINFVLDTTSNLDKYDLIIIPGGFSYGDNGGYGTIAAKTSVVTAVKNAALRGVPILGICNGFQILTASKILEGELLPNKNKQFISKSIELKIINNNTIFTKNYQKKELIKLPIAHYAGKYYANEELIKSLEDNNQIIMKYNKNINGSSYKIAAICNKKKNILGIMPHPENYYISHQGGTDGAKLFKSLLKSIM